jgi:acyl transferase domain-containing protein/acyl carrier protein
VDKVGMNDNFFDLGGHSLLMTRMRSRLQEMFHRRIPMVDLFRNPTVGSLAGYLGERQQAPSAPQQHATQAHAGAEPLRPQSPEIAVIGMAGRFPGAKNIDEFWRNLRDGVESVTFFSEAELAEAGVDASVMRHPNFVNAGAALDDIEMFDAAFFGYSPREAEVMDPQHRIFLECAWEALENAGYDSESYARPVGVFAGTSLSSYLFNLYPLRDRLEVWGFPTLLGNDKDFLPTRASYKLNLKGPSLTVQTACSTSLVAVHLACQSLLNGECDMAMAGGVSVSHLHRAGYFYQDSGPLSPDGHCRAFDAKSKGTIFGSGVGIVILKRLDDALADGDNTLAVIKGTAINNDGSFKVGYTAPSVSGQAEVIARAQAVAGVEPETITYVETHGTGTELGDPIEVAALSEVFKKRTDKKGFCAIGSVKTNVGHLDAAAGVAGLIKTVLALQNKALPPSLNFETPNPGIDFDDTPFYVNTKLQEWQSQKAPRRAAVSSFGIGGTNAHVILEEAPARAERAESRPEQLLVLSAKTISALQAAALNLADHLKRNPGIDLADVAHTLQLGRRAFNHARAIVCQTVEEAIDLLETPDRKQVFDGLRSGRGRSILFMFPGGGSQYPNMGLELYRTEPAFRASIDLCSELLKQYVDYDLRKFIYPQAGTLEEASARLGRVSVALPALFVTEYSLARLLMAWGIEPRSMIGHSLGEYVAACLAGVISLEDALAVVALRGRLLEGLPTGAMLSVALPEEQVGRLLNDKIYLAAINAPSLCVVSGSPDDIAEFEKRLLDRGVESHRLRVSAAGHSEKVAPMLGEFTAFLKTLKLHAPKIPYISNVTGTWIKPEEATAPDYWASHLRNTVRFASGVKTLLEQESNTILLEVGPSHTLCMLTRQCIDNQSDHVVLSSVRHPADNDSDAGFLLKTLARLWVAGVDIDWRGFYGDERRKRVPLPAYPFERKRYWIDHRQISDAVERAQVGARGAADQLYASLWKQSALPSDLEAITEAQASKTWLLFVDECGIASRIAKRLRELRQNVVEVMAGERFAKLRDGLFSIAPARREDYSALFEELRSSGRVPQTILHLRNVTEDCAVSEAGSFDELQYSAFYSLLFIVQALGEKNLASLAGGQSTEPIHIEVASNNAQAVTGDEAVHPAKAMSIGICRVIPREYSNITCRSVDIPVPEAGSWKEDRLIDHLIAESMGGASDSAVAYRGMHRWVQSFEPTRASERSDSRKRLRQGGVYLITGGLGNLGLEIAHYLASSVKAKLILIDHTVCVERGEQGLWQASGGCGDDTQRSVEKLRQIDELGAEVLLMRADVTDPQQMLRVAEQARERFGKVDGIVHAAGITGGSLIEMQTPEALASFLAPRVKGAQVIDALLGDAELDFLLLCSSKSAAVGGLGLADYCAADAFLRAFAHLSNSTKGRLAVAVGWDDWSVGDYQAAAASRNGEQATEAITYQEAGRVINLALSSELAYVVVSAKDLNALVEQGRAAATSNRSQEEAADAAPDKVHERPDLRNSYVAPRNEVERTIADIWQRLLGIQQVGIDDNFFELGGHSLIAIGVMSQLRESFHVELHMATLFESPTVAGLAETIQRAMSSSTRPAAPSIGLASRDAYRVKASQVEAGSGAAPKTKG